MNLDQIKELLRSLIGQAETIFIGQKLGKQRKQWCIDKALKLLEGSDQHWAIIGFWMDLPVVDLFERWLVSQAVEWAFVSLQIPQD
jgi:hypothetical protein